MKIMVSACLLGENCKYNGGNNLNPELLRLLSGHTLIPVCPEVLGGLPVPRTPAEIVNGTVINKDNASVDGPFRRGAEKALEAAVREQPDLIILQSRSPSCGVREIYDGTFSGRLIPGRGIFAGLALQSGFHVMDVEEVLNSSLIVRVNRSGVRDAARIHSVSWQDSHRSFCTEDFVAQHSPAHQEEYLLKKMNDGSRVFMLISPEPVGIVSLKDNLIEDLYVLPECQGKGYGSALLRYAVSQCAGTPTLWILENNLRAEKLYLKAGFRKTGKRKTITRGLDEIEFALDPPIAKQAGETIQVETTNNVIGGK